MAPRVPASTYRRGTPSVSLPGRFRGFGEHSPIRFRLYPEPNSSLHLIVQVWPALEPMRKYMSETYPGSGSHEKTLGMCSSFKVIAYRKGKRPRTRPIFGELNLCVANLSMRVVTHEIFHATLAYARRVGIALGDATNDDAAPGTFVCDVEERLCEIHGDLCANFVDRATALGLYDDQILPQVREERSA